MRNPFDGVYLEPFALLRIGSVDGLRAGFAQDKLCGNWG
jgi:hypothetical protein